MFYWVFWSIRLSRYLCYFSGKSLFSEKKKQNKWEWRWLCGSNINYVSMIHRLHDIFSKRFFILLWCWIVFGDAHISNLIYFVRNVTVYILLISFTMVPLIKMIILPPWYHGTIYSLVYIQLCIFDIFTLNNIGDSIIDINFPSSSPI